MSNLLNPAPQVSEYAMFLLEKDVELKRSAYLSARDEYEANPSVPREEILASAHRAYAEASERRDEAMS